MDQLDEKLSTRFNIQKDICQKLRNSQKASLGVSFDYLNQDNNKKSCIVSLPTGGGKTGIICLLSHYSSQKRVLVLCHRKAVKKQLEGQLSGGFFEKIGVEKPACLKNVYKDISDTDGHGIYVSTFQKLRLMSEPDMVKLRSNFDLVIVDEGHSEPSPEWSKLTRGLDSYKVVVTATPYRNDLFQFDVSHEYAYFYSFKEAVEANDIESPSFEIIEKSKVRKIIKKFLNDNSGAKCIVKCKEGKDIEEYYELLNKEFNVLAVHNSLPNDKRENAKVDVPRELDKSDIEVIIHQRKLDEGVDIPQAKLLILTYPVGSGRELVQTVGRIVRKHNGIPAEIKEFCGRNSRIWKNYLKFDDYLSNPFAAKKFFKALDLSALLNSYTESFPDMSYLGNSYASKLDLDSDKLIDSIEIPLLSVVFKHKSNDYDFQDVIDTLALRSTREGEYVKELQLGQIDKSGSLKGFVSISFNSSKYLRDMFFFEPKIHIFIAKDFEKFVSIFDSKGRKFIKEKGLNLGRSITISELLSLAGETKKVKTKEMSASSISSTNRRPDSVSMKSSDLEGNPISQSNAAYAISNTKISNMNEDDKVQSSYYLGSASGRVSDQKISGLSIEEFSSWLDGLYEKLCEGNITSSHLLKSYAIPVDEEPKSKIENVIFDFSDSCVELEVGGEAITLPNEFIYIQYFGDHGFLLPGIESSRFSIEYNSEDRSILLTLKSDGVLIVNGDYVEQSVSDYLSDRLEKILYEDGLCYAGSHFYKHQLPIQGGFDPVESGLDNDFIPLVELSKLNLKEKYEKKVKLDEFHSNSIFYLIDMLKNISLPDPTKKSLGPFYDYIPNLDLMLCTDMGTEQADFVLSSKSKLVFVHVKCGKAVNMQSSAGALFEVGSQALKNMEHMISSNMKLKASNRGHMIKSWPTGSADKVLRERVRVFNGNRINNPNNDSQLRETIYDEVWEEIISRRISPRVEKEVWIVTGNAFSKSHFFDQLTKGDEGKAESLQAYQLIQSWYSTLASEDIGLKFFVSE